MINLLQAAQILASDDSITHWVLGSGIMVSIIGAAVSFGSMKADRKNDRKALEDHSNMDDDRFKSFDKKLEEIGVDTRAIRSYIDEQKGYNRAIREKEF